VVRRLRIRRGEGNIYVATAWGRFTAPFTAGRGGGAPERMRTRVVVAGGGSYICIVYLGSTCAFKAPFTAGRGGGAPERTKMAVHICTPPPPNHTHTHTYIYTYIHIYTYTHIYIYIYTYTYI